MKSSKELNDLAAQVKALSTADKLTMAGQLFERGSVAMARRIADMAVVEMVAAELGMPKP